MRYADVDYPIAPDEERKVNKTPTSSIPDLPLSVPTNYDLNKSEVQELIDDFKKSDQSHTGIVTYLTRISELYLKKSGELGNSIASMASTFTMQKQSGLGVSEAENLAKSSHSFEIEKIRGELTVLSILERLLHQLLENKPS